jgi:tRNA-Thr(GGU) m(6)t(6)A37 methyltransferase TsaA
MQTPCSTNLPRELHRHYHGRMRSVGNQDSPLSGKPLRPRTKRTHGPLGARLRPVGVIRSELKARRDAPKQGSEGAPDAWLEVRHWAEAGLHRLVVGGEIIVITWFHQARRDVLEVHPRSNPRNPLTGVFATRSPDRPNPLGLHPVVVRAIDGNRLRVGPIEAIDGTPVIDIKPVLACGSADPNRERPRRKRKPAGRKRAADAGTVKRKG